MDLAQLTWVIQLHSFSFVNIFFSSPVFLFRDIDKIREGLGDKLGIIIQWLSTAVSGFVLCFIYSWRLTLVMLATYPPIVLFGALMAMVRLCSQVALYSIVNVGGGGGGKTKN